MTEAQWLTCSDPVLMLTHLADRVSERKARLFSVACARLVWHHLSDGSRRAVDVAERSADRLVDADALAAARAMALHAAPQTPLSAGPIRSPAQVAWCATRLDVRAAARDAALGAACYARGRRLADRLWVHASGKAQRAVRADLAHLLRDVVGNPFRPVAVAPAWFAWNGATVRRLAEVIDAERVFERLPLLADALEEAGCDDAALLDHCRAASAHVRGCWAVDLLLGRG